MVGASWKRDPSIQGIGWPPELSVGSRIKDNSEETRSETEGNAQLNGWVSSAVGRWAVLVLVKGSELCAGC